MHADCYFRTGASHKVCQDYARVCNRGTGGLAAFVSDGCSGLPDTDIGARLVCLAAESHWDVYRGGGSAEALVHELRRHHLEGLCGGNAALHATLLSICVTAPASLCGSHVRVSGLLCGDGAMAVKTHGGALGVVRVEYDPDSSGVVAPFYPIYAGDRHAIDVRQRRGGPKRRRVTLTYPESHPVPLSLWDVCTAAADHEDAQDFSYRVYPSSAAIVAIFSDGVESFRRPGTGGRLEPVPMHEVIEHLMDFKTLAGEFVTRRCRSFLERFCAAEGWVHTDDFSMAAVVLDPPGAGAPL